MSKLLGYIVGHDFGFAPNPFGGVCSIACCKSRVRRIVSNLDRPTDALVFGTGSIADGAHGKLIFWAKVSELIDFKSYYSDVRFASKKPAYDTGTQFQFGDNIYEWDELDGRYRQHHSFHSHKDGSTNEGNYQSDTGQTESVLISRDFAYFGAQAPEIPPHLSEMRLHGHEHRDVRTSFSREQEDLFADWIDGLGRGYLGDPIRWGKLKVT